MRPRIVSLLPAGTEIVAALGFEESLVGRSHECDFPAGVERVPICTEPRLNPRAAGDEIHRSVERLLSDSLSVYRVDAARLKALAPTHVVTQVQCEVCAVSLADVERALLGWTGRPPRLVSLSAARLEDVFEDMRRTAGCLGAEERGQALVDGLARRIEAVAAKARAADTRPRVAAIEWLSPLMAAGNWMPELVALAGGENLFGAAGRHSPWLDWVEVAAADPDVLVAFPCGFSLARTVEEAGILPALPGWDRLRAVRDGRVFLADGNAYFNRPGPRLVETLEILAEILHPTHFGFGHEGTGWTRLG
ncbi:MAG: cobalamin-binding protein [Thermoanaerobaculia bacterium]